MYKSNLYLPKEIKALPIKAQTLFRETYNRVIKAQSNAVAMKVAWKIVGGKFKKEGNSWIAKGMGFDLFTFNLENKGDAFISKGKDGEHYLEATLSDDMTDSQGKRFTKETLQDYANQINQNGLLGFITHQDYKDFCMKYSHLPESVFVAKARNERKGILKTIKAIYENGKLWIKAVIDKRYLNRVKQFSKVSIEALIPKRFQVGNEYRGGYPIGFALDNNAINRRAVATVV